MRTESHDESRETKAHQQLKDLSTPFVRESSLSTANGGDLFEMDTDTKTSSWKGDIRTDDKLRC